MCLMLYRLKVWWLKQQIRRLGDRYTEVEKRPDRSFDDLVEAAQRLGDAHHKLNLLRMGKSNAN